MKPGARLQTVIEILEAIEKASIPMDLTCGDYFRHRRYIGAKDRSYIATTVYGVMRCYSRVNWWLEKLDKLPTPRNRLLVYSVFFGNGEEPEHFDGSRHAPASLTEDESELVNNLKAQNTNFHSKDMPPHIRYECPEIYEERLKNKFADRFAEELSALNAEATLDLRVNTVLAPRDKVKAMLEADGINTIETPYSPWGLRCRDKVFLSRSKAWGKGWIEIQDEGAQLISLLCDCRPGEQVLDYCAGAGGKTLALANMMGGKGRIIAMDMHAARLEKSRQRLKRAGVSDCVELRPLQDTKNRRWLKRQKAKFDCVLLDVPCSGTGTWRRNPDLRRRQYGPGLEELLTIQKEILDDTAPLVKPGGRIVYATCSLLEEENEEQIRQFLNMHPDFTVIPPYGLFPPGNACPVETGEEYMTLTPYRHGTDGFFAACLQKQNRMPDKERS